MDKHSPASIGILDSGVGGLSVLREIHSLLPRHPIHYFGDQAWCPYGSKPPEVIRERVFHLADQLIEEGAELLVIACNSATIHAVGALRAVYPHPIVGMEPGVKPAARLTQSGVVGVLATEASFAGEKFHGLVRSHADHVRVITQPCPRFVELVESGQVDGPSTEDAIKEAVHPILEEGADVLVLGCTHYPFLRQAMERVLPDGVQIVDTGSAVARRVRTLMEDEFPTGEGSEVGEIRLSSSGERSDFERLAHQLLGGLNLLFPPTR
ncbi:MAG: glutamate racemase [Verrucomicrobiota bacterium]